MKKLLSILLFFVCIKSFSQTTFPIKQNMGSSTTNVQTAGTYGTLTGFTWTTDYVDTTTANLALYVKYTPGIVIKTGTTFWVRNSTVSAWVQMSGSGGGSTLSSLGSAYKIAVNGTNNVKSLSVTNGLTPDSATSGQVGIKLGGAFTGITTLTGTGSLGPSNTFNINAVKLLVNFSPGTNQPQINANGSGTTIGHGGTNWSYSQWVLGFMYNRAKDSIQLGVGDTLLAPNALTTYVNLYPHRFYTTTDGNLVLGAGTYADQYATDSLNWRMANRTSSFNLRPSFAHTYSDDSLVLESETGYYRFTDMLSTADSTTYKPVVMNVNGKIRRGNSWGNFSAGGSSALSSLTAATGNNSINNADNLQSWAWTTLTNGPGLQLISNGTTANNGQQLLLANLLGANGTSGVTSVTGTFQNTHTGTTSTNVAIQASASSGTNNIAIDATGATAALKATGPINLNGASSPLQVGGSAGTSGQFLQSAGSGNTPVWAGAIKTAGTSTATGAITLNMNSTGDFSVTGGQVLAQDGFAAESDGNNSIGNTGSHTFVKASGSSGTDDVTIWGNNGTNIKGTLNLPDYSDGTMEVSSGIVVTTSDMNLKNSIGSYKPGLRSIMLLNPSVFRWNFEKNNSRLHPGFIAQNVRKALGSDYVSEKDGVLSYSDKAILGALVNAVKELKAENDELRKEVNLLKKKK